LIRKTTFLLLAMMIVAAACTTPDVVPPQVVPAGNDRYLIDPRTGYAETIPAPLAQRFEYAWRYALGGNEAEAERRLAEILAANPGFEPARLAQAAMAIRNARYADARGLLEGIDTLAARVYRAELAYREGRTREAFDLYRALAAGPNAPAAAEERLSELQATLFNESFAAAQAATDAEAVRLLREALALNAGATEARVLLVQKLVGQRQYDEARRELDPLLNTIPDRAEVQEILAEIDAGRGRYQEAIVRYERLARRSNDPRHTARLEAIKQEWSAANMPAHFRTAMESTSLTRADFATLLYWSVPSIRFAQNLATPPIAIDVEGVAGREEVIRAMAIGLYEVDPVTRRVSPSRQITASRLATLLARVLTLRGAPCARGMSADRVLAACGVTDPLAGREPDDAVTGREAMAALQQVAKALS
jgi:tetratricopeptide (TPR) repeat protein